VRALQACDYAPIGRKPCSAPLESILNVTRRAAIRSRIGLKRLPEAPSIGNRGQFLSANRPSPDKKDSGRSCLKSAVLAADSGGRQADIGVRRRAACAAIDAARDPDKKNLPHA
jgi:hypothetical protein